MIELVEQSTLYRLIAIVVTLVSFLQILKYFLGWGTSGTGVWPLAPELSRVLVAALLGGFLVPIIIVLVPGQVGTLLYNIFSFGNPSSLVIVGLILGALFGVIYRQLVDRVMFGVAGAIGMAIWMGFMALLAGGVVAALQSGGQWGAILDEALSWGWIGAKIGAVLGLVVGAVGALE